MGYHMLWDTYFTISSWNKNHKWKITWPPWLKVKFSGQYCSCNQLNKNIKIEKSNLCNTFDMCASSLRSTSPCPSARSSATAAWTTAAPTCVVICLILRRVLDFSSKYKLLCWYWPSALAFIYYSLQIKGVIIIADSHSSAQINFYVGLLYIKKENILLCTA